MKRGPSAEVVSGTTQPANKKNRRRWIRETCWIRLDQITDQVYSPIVSHTIIMVSCLRPSCRALQICRLQRPSNDNNDSAKRHRGNHSKPGRIDKSGEAEEEKRGQSWVKVDWKQDVRLRFFFPDPSQPGPFSLHSLTTTTTNVQTTNPRFMYSNHEIVKRNGAVLFQLMQVPLFNSFDEFFC
jgi:hypothetical protein